MSVQTAIQPRLGRKVGDLLIFVCAHGERMLLQKNEEVQAQEEFERQLVYATAIVGLDDRHQTVATTCLRARMFQFGQEHPLDTPPAIPNQVTPRCHPEGERIPLFGFPERALEVGDVWNSLWPLVGYEGESLEVPVECRLTKFDGKDRLEVEVTGQSEWAEVPSRSAELRGSFSFSLEFGCLLEAELNTSQVFRDQESHFQAQQRMRWALDERIPVEGFES